MRRVSPDKGQREFAPPPESNEDCPEWLRERVSFAQWCSNKEPQVWHVLRRLDLICRLSLTRPTDAQQRPPGAVLDTCKVGLCFAAEHTGTLFKTSLPNGSHWQVHSPRPFLQLPLLSFFAYGRGLFFAVPCFELVNTAPHCFRWPGPMLATLHAISALWATCEPKKHCLF